jgi:hypothetical protein
MESVRCVVRILILLAALVVVIAIVARWWFWSRTQSKGRRIECSITVADLYEKLEVPKRKPSQVRDAAALGSALRDAGMLLLERDGNALAKKRRFGWWNLKALPAFVVLILVFSYFQPRIASRWVMAIGCLLLAIQVLLRISGIGLELMAVKRGWLELEKKGGFRRMSEQEAVLRCARASVWNTILPW